MPVAVLVGESPGAEEAEVGLPFCGATGKFLDRELEAVGLDRSKLFVVNAVLCAPSEKNSRRMKRAVQCCAPAFELQVRGKEHLHRLAMGRYAALALGYTKLGKLEKARGFIRDNAKGA